MRVPVHRQFSMKFAQVIYLKELNQLLQTFSQNGFL